MHGRVKVRTTAELEELKKIERAKKVVRYRAAVDLIFKKRMNKKWDDELLLATETVLLKNPDVYTLWNVRREAFENNNWSAEEIDERMRKELTLTEACLRENPKSYCVWHQRSWIMDRLSNPDWMLELSLCAKCLDFDERNFHCWDYRRYVVRKAEISEAEEFDFSTTKILGNFSNYSSWQYRSKILPKLFPSDTEGFPIRLDKHRDELDLVSNATFTDPNDSSAWLYQRWLLNDRKTFTRCFWAARVDDHAATVVFRWDVIVNSTNLLLMINGNTIDTEWGSYDDKKFAKLWIARFLPGVIDRNKIDTMEIIFEGNANRLSRSDGHAMWACEPAIATTKENNVTQMADQLESYDRLIDMEPENKWALSARVFFMRNIDRVKYHERILEDLKTLSYVDKLRSNYYNDLRSECSSDYNLLMALQMEPIEKTRSKVDLSNLGLTILRNEQFFCFFEEINLGGNLLENALHRLNSLQSCRKLSLSCNNLRGLTNFPVLRHLKFLSLRNNALTNMEEILNVIRQHDLQQLDLRDNPVCHVNDVLATISKISPTLTVLVNS